MYLASTAAVRIADDIKDDKLCNKEFTAPGRSGRLSTNVRLCEGTFEMLRTYTIQLGAVRVFRTAHATSFGGGRRTCVAACAVSLPEESAMLSLQR